MRRYAHGCTDLVHAEAEGRNLNLDAPTGQYVCDASWDHPRYGLVGSKSPSLYFSITGRSASHHFASPALSTFSCSLMTPPITSSLSSIRTRRCTSASSLGASFSQRLS